jgi:O-acetyl-ADP-ribose deacetylase (regulator of RNase III)
VIHTVGPIWKDGNQREEDLLKSAITSALREASNARLKSISIPVIRYLYFYRGN